MTEPASPFDPTPPPMHPQSAEAYLQQPVLSDGKTVSGTHGMSIREVEDDIMRGGTFRLFAYNFSIIVMSFRRSSPLTYVRSSQWIGPQALLWSLPSFLVGWWGIPWGIVFTLMSLYRNSVGGTDVTREVLQQLVGPQRSAGILARAPKKSADPVLWLLRLVAIGVPGAFIAMVISAINAKH